MFKAKSSLIVAILFSVFILVFAVSPSNAQKVIKVGSIQSLTGPAAPWGIPIDKGLHVMAEILNEAGGVTVGGEKYIFKIYSENDKFSAKGGRAAAEKLINRVKVKYIVGTWYDAALMALRHFSNENKVIVLQGSSGDPHTIGPKYPYLFRFTQDPRGKLGVLDIALKTMSFKKMAIFNVDTALGRGNSAAAADWAKEIGIEVTDNVLAPAATTDFYPFLKKVLDHKPEMIHGSISPSKYALVCKQAHELGYRGYYSNVGSLTNVKGMIEIAGQDAIQGYIAPFEDMRCPAITEKNRKLMTKIQKRYLEKYGPPFEPLAWRYTIGLQVLAQALEKAQSFDPDVVVKTMENTEFDTLLGKGGFAGTKTYGIQRQLIINTIAAIIKGDKAEYLGYVTVKRP
ncbi:MAG: ABC transporter substrate-binding protein [Deltaproteobacteria bacterium]|nr:ABC transporter substrate-binding protein [Deltaproteobacteria bacterium]